jgi:hypothetical protein
MSEFTRRSFIGKTAVAIGSFAALQKVVGADLSKTSLKEPVQCDLLLVNLLCSLGQLVDP